MRTSLAALATAGLALTTLAAVPAHAKPKPAPVVDVYDTTGSESVASTSPTLQVRLDRKATKRVKVTWRTVNGSATADSDYVALSGTLVFAPGERAKKIGLVLLDDDERERTEFFYVQYTVKGAKAARKRAAVSIIDNDIAPYTGDLTITERWEQEANGFHTLQTWTLTLRPRFVSMNEGTAWYDDGFGEWELTGSRILEDRRPGADCRKMEEEVYSGQGTFFTEPHPDTDVSGTEGNLVLAAFFPHLAGNLGQKPWLHAVVSGHTDGTSYTFNGETCEPSEYENEERFALMEAPGKVASTGVVFDHHLLQDNSDGHGLDTYQLDVTGELVPMPPS